MAIPIDLFLSCVEIIEDAEIYPKDGFKERCLVGVNPRSKVSEDPRPGALDCRLLDRPRLS